MSAAHVAFVITEQYFLDIIRSVVCKCQDTKINFKIYKINEIIALP